MSRPHDTSAADEEPRAQSQGAGFLRARHTLTPSCAKLKENVESLEESLELLKQLRAVRFDWKEDSNCLRSSKRDVGFIAEEVDAVLPELVFQDEAGEVLGVDYARMSAVAVGAIRELLLRNEELTARVSRLEGLCQSHPAGVP